MRRVKVLATSSCLFVFASFLAFRRHGATSKDPTIIPQSPSVLDVHADNGTVPLSHVKAFQIPTFKEQIRWPELEIPTIKDKPPAALIISGGGSRAYISGLGYLRALTDLGLMSKFRYVGGVSGGGWLLSAYSYFQPDKYVSDWGKTASTDEELLGPVTQPESITNETLSYINPASLRRSVTQQVFLTFFKSWLSERNFPDGWILSVWSYYLRGAGIPRPFPVIGNLGGKDIGIFTYNNDTEISALERNPHLREAGYKFIKQKEGRPLLSIALALMGPQEQIPIKLDNRSYRIIECNPLYTGRFMVQDVEYVSIDNETVTCLVGGAVETYAFGSNPPPNLENQALSRIAQEGVITNVELPNQPFTLSQAAAIGGWAPALNVASDLENDSGQVERTNEIFGQNYPYWSPSKSPLGEKEGAGGRSDEPYVYGDGGLNDNLNLASLLRREEIERFVICVQTSIPLNMSYDPLERPPTYDDIDNSIYSAFGIEASSGTTPFFYEENHVFASEQYPELVQKFQEAARKGDGIIAEMTTQVVENPTQGVRGNRTVDVIWVYLGRAFNWENKLPEWLRTQIAPEEKNTKVLPGKNSSFPFFPHYPTWPLDMTPEQANLLADLSGWVVDNNKEVFLNFLSDNSSTLNSSATTI
mmetsp:Transcript_24988/g.34765  ORF Transcript_24988/g.34765 Transcript_24988/m.34765 type:complete len:645 (-) Transcript_24988:46-1980(-)|eukprot:CAMPEP_0184497258 /NCGR_PEP_ID=MMETSP0113_2-20130426/36035_1 /TAXON_ID=91329 /ORGANISM="Norrisiella sphaerica, Strain BC52" /LENGTH=644 /DNA_ID=CAMNT_0026884275 /DNA_START=93 /DNA_END=2027 /DNA_ORIENTATION=+